MTKAAEFTNQVDSQIASDRLTRLQKRQDEILDAIADEKLNKEYEVYFDELRNNSMVAGRSDNNSLICVKGSEELLGQLLKVKVTNPKRAVLYGEIVG